jgi:hypothetical protein
LRKERAKRSRLWKMPVDEFASLIRASLSWADVMRHFGYGTNGNNWQTAKNRCHALGIDSSHFLSKRDMTALRNPEIPLDQILVENSTYCRSHLKRRLLRLGLLTNECSICRLGPTWNGKPITMRLDHVNGKPNDNRIDNLRMVCPNCDSQLETFTYRNIRTQKKCAA